MPFIQANGVRLHYHLQGSGTPIVFLHPACMGSRVFTYLRNDLAQDNRTLLFDFRGHGRSESSNATITIRLLVEDTRRLMDALGIPSAYLCAYSMSAQLIRGWLYAQEEAKLSEGEERGRDGRETELPYFPFEPEAGAESAFRAPFIG